jgi:type IV secretory pathway TraG/TraD family ATPase VirD4
MDKMEKEFFQLLMLICRWYVQILIVMFKASIWMIKMTFIGLKHLYHYISEQIALKSQRTVSPGEALPSRPHRDIWDYRGLAMPKELSTFLYNSRASVKLGQATNADGMNGEKLGIPLDIITQHTFLVGPSGEGKTTRFIVPWIKELLSYQSVFAIDAKGNLRRKFSLHKSAELTGAKFWYWNLADAESQRWNFFEEISLDLVERSKDIATIAKALLGDKESLPADQRIFWERDLAWLEAILWVLVETEPAPKPSQILPMLFQRREVEVRFSFVTPDIKKKCNNLLSDYFEISETDFYKATFVLRNKLRFFDEPHISQICDGRSDFLLKELNSSNIRVLLLVGQPETEGEKGKQMGQLIAGMFTNVMLRRYTSSIKSQPIAFIADEAHTLKETVNFEKSAALLREADVSVFICTQSINQFNTREQPDQGSRIAGLCATKIALPGVDIETAKWLSDNFGDRLDPGIDIGREFGGHRYGVEGGKRTPILSVREIRERPPHLEKTAIAQTRYGTSTKPFLVKY